MVRKDFKEAKGKLARKTQGGGEGEAPGGLAGEEGAEGGAQELQGARWPGEGCVDPCLLGELQKH